VAGVSRRVITDAIAGRLRAGAPMVTVYVGEVPDTPPTDPDGRVHVYAVLYPGPGTSTQDRLVPIVDGLLWTGQVTCVGGDVNRCLACADAVTDALTGRTIYVPGTWAGYMRELGDPGPAREDRDARPSRWFIPLTYQLHATRRVTGA
jgi:hypothetical protein